MAAMPYCSYAQIYEDEEDEFVTEEEEEMDEADDDDAMPIGMEDELDQLLQEWNNKSYLIPEGDCNDTGENPEFSRETYVYRLSRLPNIVEMPYNDIVRKFIDRYTGTLRRSVSIILGASNFYMPLFEEALEAYQVPLELKYLPVIESALNPQATSRVGAAGLWQFMIGTGKQYGLEVTSLIDERRDPIKSSYAAAHYLKDLYGIFGDWTLVIASYNCGPNNVRKAIARAGGEKDFWKIYPYLPAETRGYVPAFIAANYVMNYYCEHNICPAGTVLPASTDTLSITRNLHKNQVVAICNVKAEELEALNPQYRTGLIPGDSHHCTLRLPTPAIAAFIESGDSIYRYHADELFTSRKEVEVAQAQLSSPSSSKAKRTTRSRRTSKAKTRSTTVRKGETLSTIAARNKTTVAQLRKKNGIKGDKIVPGQKLKF